MGDYHRYLAEFATGDKRKDSADKSLEAYKAASNVAITELPPTHPRLRSSTVSSWSDEAMRFMFSTISRGRWVSCAE